LRKIWEAMALFVIGIIFVGIISEAIKPFLPLIGLVVSFLLVGTVVVVVIRFIARRKSW
jgi:hypothetical protein